MYPSKLSGSSSKLGGFSGSIPNQEAIVGQVTQFVVDSTRILRYVTVVISNLSIQFPVSSGFGGFLGFEKLGNQKLVLPKFCSELLWRTRTDRTEL
jgi:hypothetical protein